MPFKGRLQISYQRFEFADPGAKRAFQEWARTINGGKGQSWDVGASGGNSGVWEPRLKILGVGCGTYRMDGQQWCQTPVRGVTMIWSSLGAPYWMWVLLTATLPVIYFGSAFLKARRLKIRRRDGLCLNCGYDLRASKERCPECGTPVATTDAVAAP